MRNNKTKYVGSKGNYSDVVVILNSFDRNTLRKFASKVGVARGNTKRDLVKNLAKSGKANFKIQFELTTK